MEITDGVAYGEPFESVTAGVRLEGDGARLENIQAIKGGGRGTGAAFVGWNGTYSFNFDARSIPAESLAAAKKSPRPIAGLIDFTAGGSGTFDSPRYDVRGTVRDLFVADEGIGQIVGNLSIDNELMTVRLEAASPRLAVSASGRIALTPELDSELTISCERHVARSRTCARSSRSCLLIRRRWRADPSAWSASSPTSITCWSTQRSNGSTSGCSTTRCATRDRSALRWIVNAVRVTDMRIVGQDTQLDVSGLVNLHDSRIAIRTTGDANLAVLQGFVADVRSSGMAALSATLEGPLEDPSREWHARHHRRPDQAFRPAARAREHQWLAEVRHARRHARWPERSAGARRRARSADASTSRATCRARSTST